MRKIHALYLSSAIALGLSGTLAHASMMEDAVKLRGAGKSRDALTLTHNKPFDQALWSQLSGFSGGDPVTAESTKEKVVLVVTWASWLRTSHPAMRAAQEALNTYKDRGLVVLGVHHPTQHETAADHAKTLGVSFPIAVDKDGKFRSALQANQDPNIYVIDRAGNMRYAQIEVGSIDAAVKTLVEESVQDAKDLPTRLADSAKAAERERWKTRDLSIDPSRGGPEVEFADPDEELYKKASWPWLFGKVEKDKILEKIKNDPPKITNWPEDDWFPSPPKARGKLKVVYFMDPQDAPMLNIIPVMNRVANKYQRDVVVVGSLFKQGVGGIGTDTQGAEDQDKVKQRNKEYLSKIVAGRSLNHPLNPTLLQAENMEFSAGSLLPRIQRSNTEFGIAIIMSTDNRIRWMGDPATNDLGVAIERIAEADPGVQARRKAEAKAAKK